MCKEQEKEVADREMKETSMSNHRRNTLFLFSEIYFLIGQLVLGLASGLEAFSREPPCDSIGALAARQTPETSGMAWEFLSYYPILPSRYLRDPLSYLVYSCVFSEFTEFPDQRTKYVDPEETQAQSPHYGFSPTFSQFPAK